jgi:hypothetical protein
VKNALNFQCTRENIVKRTNKLLEVTKRFALNLVCQLKQSAMPSRVEACIERFILISGWELHSSLVRGGALWSIYSLGTHTECDAKYPYENRNAPLASRFFRRSWPIDIRCIAHRVRPGHSRSRRSRICPSERIEACGMGFSMGNSRICRSTTCSHQPWAGR